LPGEIYKTTIDFKGEAIFTFILNNIKSGDDSNKFYDPINIKLIGLSVQKWRINNGFSD